MPIETKKDDKVIKEEKKIKSYKALKTTKVICNGTFELVEGQDIPKGIDKAFIPSLISSNLIK